MQPRDHRFVGSELDSICFKEPFLGVVEGLTRQIHNEQSDIVGEADLQTAAKVLGSAIDGIGARQKNLLWDGLCSLCLAQSFPVKLCTFFPNNSRTL